MENASRLLIISVVCELLVLWGLCGSSYSIANTMIHVFLI